MRVAHMGETDPVIFLSNLGDAREGAGGQKVSHKTKRVQLTGFQTPRFHQGTLNFGRERGEPEGEHEGGEEEGEQRGRAKPRTDLGTTEGKEGYEGSRGSKRKSESSSSQAPS